MSIVRLPGSALEVVALFTLVFLLALQLVSDLVFLASHTQCATSPTPRGLAWVGRLLAASPYGRLWLDLSRAVVLHRRSRVLTVRVLNLLTPTLTGGFVLASWRLDSLLGPAQPRSTHTGCRLGGGFSVLVFARAPAAGHASVQLFCSGCLLDLSGEVLPLLVLAGAWVWFVSKRVDGVADAVAVPVAGHIAQQLLLDPAPIAFQFDPPRGTVLGCSPG